MSASLDRPAPQYAEPGPDQRGMTMSEAVDMVLMSAGKDGVLDMAEQREVQRLMSGLQAIAMQKAAMAQSEQQQPGMSDETEDFGATDGTEPTDGSEPMPGNEFMGGGY